MLDQSLVRSGFDAEILLGERQLSYILLTLVDAGVIPVSITAGDPPRTFLFGGPDDLDRTYEPNPDAPALQEFDPALNPFGVEILFGHASGADVRVHGIVGIAEIDLFVRLTPDITHDASGAADRAGLQVEVVDIASTILENDPTSPLDKANVLAEIKARVDRTVDLGGTAAFKRIHDIAVVKHPADGTHAAAYGLYVNLRLRNGPEEDALRPLRGDLAAALNFLPPGSDMAMATRAGLFADLAADTWHRFAEIDENGDVSHPWRKSPFNPRSKKIGSIVDVSIGPNLQGNAIRVDVEVEYEIDNFVDPNGHLVLTLTPSVNDEGTFRWKIDADFHASLALELIGLFTLIGLVALTGGLAGLGLGAAISTGVIGGMLGDAIGHAIVDLLYSGAIEAKVDAGLPEVISGRVAVAQRRWDPFYTTAHQVGMRPDGGLINGNGLAIWGRAVVDREIVLMPSAVIRDKRAVAPSPPTHLRYRIWDAANHADDFIALAPGTDRRSFEQVDPAGEPELVDLSVDEVVARMAEGRVVKNLAYHAKRIDLRQGQIHAILTISDREVRETRNRLIAAFENETAAAIEAADGAQIRADVLQEFADAGVVPTDEEVDARVAEVIAERVEPLRKSYEDGALNGDVENALLPQLRLSMAPEHYGALQKKGILHLEDVTLVTMRAPGHAGFMYYRDWPDGDARDNLLQLPHYRETDEGVELL